ncbi:TonB-dependent receptor [Sphingobacterium bambusae]|uniref:TonB-dependent receptor n=1 Tax=Sphingobacterium bambusae TaxID=662858 RepID=A0ABW6BL77_9SPHI|nr:TonB-dependent receptor [Sphingobacterium bambusae]WPL46685.1 TonB-dependent receptor [Sphingobacterium bambusae]
MSGRKIRLTVGCLGLCLLSLFTQAQVAIRGRVSLNGEALPSVRVDLRLEADSQMLAYTFSDERGNYRLQHAQTEKLMLQFRALGFEPISLRVVPTQADTLIDVQMQPGGVQRLQEVIVHAKQPYRNGRDTVELSVNSFLQGDERNVEDLLRKIPGINVGTDGSIKIGNKEVEKVMVEGDDFFEKGYRLLTQNMSVQPLEKIQVLQRYSNNKQLKGIENSDKVALNLQLKDDSKNQWMGTVGLQGSAIDLKYYQASANLMNFSKRSKYYLLASANNNGHDAVSSINHLIQSGSANEPGQIGVDVGTPTLIDNTPNLPYFDYRRTNFNNDKLVSLNTILNPTSALKIKWLGFVNTTKKTFYRNTVQEYNLEDIQFSITENYEFTRKIDNYFTKLELQYEPSASAMLNYTGTLGSLNSNELGELVFNNVASLETTKNKGHLTNHNLTYSRKLSEREALISSLRFISQQSPVAYSINQYYYQDLFGTDSVSEVQQQIANNLRYVGATSHYVSRQKEGNFLELALRSTYQQQQLNSQLQLLPTAEAAQQMVVSPPAFANDMTLSLFQTSAIGKYTVKQRRWELTPRLQAGMVHSRLANFEQQKRKNDLQLSPGLSAKWAIHRKGRLETDLFFQQQNATLPELIPNYYSSGVRNFVKGMDNFVNLSSSGGTLLYTYGNMSDRFFARVHIGHQILFDYIGTESELNPNFNLVQQRLLKNKTATYYKGELNYYLKSLHGNMRLDVGFNRDDYETLVTGLGSRQIRSNTYDYGLSFRSSWKSSFNIYTSYRIQSNSYRTDGTINTLTNSQAFLHLFLNLGSDLQFSLKNESYRFGSLPQQKAQTYYFSDFSVFYELKKYKTRFDITAKNILNTRSFRNAMLTDISRYTTEYRLFPRYVSFGVDYNF